MGTVFGKAKRECSPPVALSSTELYNIQNDLRSYFVLIDIRNESEYLRSHIDLSKNIYDIDEIVKAATENHYCTATILYGGGRDILGLAETLAQRVCDIEVMDKTRTQQKIMYLVESWDEYQSSYPFLCSDAEGYVEGRLFPSHIDERVFLSNYGVASNVDVISLLGITHVINCTIDCPFAELDTISTLRVPVIDDQDQQINEHFLAAIDFIQKGLLSAADNKILVHCKHGQSRSATVLAAWLIQCRGHTVESSIEYLKSRRPKVCPNKGFVEQLDHFSTQSR